MECSVRWCVSVALAVAFTLVIAGSARTTFADGADDSCAGVTGAARGLCNAYCKAQDCPDGHNGQSCARLRANWLKQTGAALFPCDAVCCECPGGGDACTTAQQCRLRQCRIIDTCQDGQCPAAVCCQCPAGGCDETTPRHCLSLGCAPAPGATCSSTGVCESPPPPCECGDQCTDAANNPGTCEPAPDGTCQCVATPPPPPCECGDQCDANGVAGMCQPVAGSTACECVPLRPCGSDPASGQCGTDCPSPQVCQPCTAATCPASCVCM